MFMRVVTGHTSNSSLAGGKKAARTEDSGQRTEGQGTEDRGQRSPQLTPWQGERSGSSSPLELTPPVLDGSRQIKANQGKSRWIKVKETAPPADFPRLSAPTCAYPRQKNFFGAIHQQC